MVTIIAARAANGVIGNRNDLPWYLPEDLAHFKKLTSSHPVIMGRKTYESILARLGKPLPGRVHFVLTSQPDNLSVADEYKQQVFVLSSLESAIDDAKKLDDEVFLIGGEKVFKDGLERAEKIELTEVHQDHEGDAYFPSFNKEEWEVSAQEDHDGYSFVTYLKK